MRVEQEVAVGRFVLLQNVYMFKGASHLANPISWGPSVSEYSGIERV